MIQRDVPAILVAHRMDPVRRELYVEGREDRLFLRWLVGSRLADTTLIQEATSVLAPAEIQGGERGRLMWFAEQVGDSAAAIRFFADADFDRLLGRPWPGRVWLTDGRDLEHYLCRDECIAKVVALGLKEESSIAHNLRVSITTQARRVGLVRVASEKRALQLPFQRTELSKHITVNGANVVVDRDEYTRALWQNGGRSLKELGAFLSFVVEVEGEFQAVNDSEIVHGKDFMCLVNKWAVAHGAGRDDGARMLWCSFEAGFVADYPALATVVEYLRQPHAA